ncbi:MAG: EAL domain-containing protein [Allosphingosinicella sp.]
MRKGRFAGLHDNIRPAAGSIGRARAAAATLYVLAAPAGVAAAALLAGDPTWTAAAAIAGIALAGWAVRSLQPAEWGGPAAGEDADRAGRLVADFEASGSGWFWETNADGLLTYVSETVAQALGRNGPDLTGRPFVELLLVELGAASDLERPTLGFHIASRFPFANVVVVPNGRKDLCWSLSGRPRFDEVGRFLGFHGVGLDLGESQRSELRSSQAAVRDSLTGLPNRAAMRAMLDAALANAASRHEGCALFLIDLDRFKHVNDTLGHPIGDLLLKEVAQRLAAAIGSEGQVGRLGGDEFEALLPGIDEEGHLAALADRVIATVSAPYLVRGHGISIGASIGIAISRPNRTLADGLVKEADLALYAAKKSGRGTYRFFEPHMHAEETERQILEGDLKQAIAKGQLKLVYQPVVNAGSEALVGFEALVRWHHPVRGPLAPAEFLAMAEAGGQICAIGEWVIRTACAEAANWPRHLRLTVNLSQAEIEHGRIVAIVASALAASELDPERFELDLTEPTLLADKPEIRSALSGLKALGVRLSLDDFGIDAASVLSLKAVPLDRIKIHPDLLRAAMPEGNRAEAVLAAVVALAETLGMDVTAEGAETAEDLALIRRLGCDDVQGYLFGRPMAPGEAMALAAASEPDGSGETPQPRPARQSLIRRGALRWDGGSSPVRLRNISPEGAMIESKEQLAPGEQVELDLSAGVRLTGEVRWTQDGRIGIRFVELFALKRLGRAGRAAAPAMVKPAYLDSELAPDSPWAARQDRLSVKDVKRK